MARYTAREIEKWDTFSQGKDYRWRPDRPINYKVDGFRKRLEYAWKVLIGKYDALDWEEDCKKPN